MIYKILFVDKDPATLRLFERLFQDDYQIINASSGEEALDLLRRNEVAIIISEQQIHGITGVEFLKQAADICKNAARILTGFTDVVTLVNAINSGVVYKYVAKPWLISDLQQTVNSALEHYDKNKRQHSLAPRNEQVSKSYNEAVAGRKRAASTLFDPGIISDFRQKESIGQIRQSISRGLSGIRRFSVRIFCDPANVPICEMLEKIKTSPTWAMETLYAANDLHPESATAQLMVAANKLGESELRQMINNYGFPLGDPQMRVWGESAIRRAGAAQVLAAYTELMNPDEAYTLGLLQDVGEILLTALFPEEMYDLMRIVDNNNRFNREVELFGIESAQVSQWMLDVCGIPPNLTAAINTRRELLRQNTPISLLMDVARQIAEAEEGNKTCGVATLGKDELATLRLSRNDLDRICKHSASINKELIKPHQEIHEIIEMALI